MGLLAVALKIVLIALFLGAAGIAIGVGIYFYKRRTAAASEA
jgi:hypothetical protein